jgi:hypothetical protein
MAWQQPTPAPGGTILRTIEMPCPHGCSGHWRHPAAERDRVVNQPDDLPQRVSGHADEANKIGADFIRAALKRWGFEDRG